MYVMYACCVWFQLQMSNILRLVSGQVDRNHVEELESQLNEARNEIQTLSTKIAKLTTDGVNILTFVYQQSCVEQMF